MSKFINSNKVLFVLLAIFLVSLFYSLYFHYQPVVDASAYDDIAWNLARGFGYRESLEGPLKNDHAIIRAGPGYEFFLAALYKIFGHRYGVVWFFQSLLHALTALLIFLISKKILKEEKANLMALAAMVFYGFSPDLIVISSMFLTETLTLFLLVLTVFIFLRYINRVNQSQALPSLAKPGFDPGIVLLGLIVPFMVLVRAQLSLVILPFLVFWVLKKRWLHLAIFFILFILILTPWTIRNYLVYGRFVPTAALFGINLMLGNHPGAIGEQMDAPYPPLDEFLREENYVEGDKKALAFALNFIREKPLEFLKITFFRISAYFSFARPTGFWPSFSAPNKIITITLSGLYSFLLFVLGIAGILFGIKKRNSDLFSKEKLLYTLAIAALMPLSVILIVVETRYRYPVYPFLSVFSGISLDRLLVKRREILKPLFYSLLVIGGNTAFDIIRNLERIFSRISNL